MIVNPSIFWVQIMKSKYDCGINTVPIIGHKANCSNPRRGIVYVWKTFEKAFIGILVLTFNLLGSY